MINCEEKSPFIEYLISHSFIAPDVGDKNDMEKFLFEKKIVILIRKNDSGLKSPGGYLENVDIPFEITTFDVGNLFLLIYFAFFFNNL